MVLPSRVQGQWWRIGELVAKHSFLLHSASEPWQHQKVGFCWRLLLTQTSQRYNSFRWRWTRKRSIWSEGEKDKGRKRRGERERERERERDVGRRAGGGRVGREKVMSKSF
jgi:hypothetical protein